jgi:hypothetical protein
MNDITAEEHARARAFHGAIRAGSIGVGWGVRGKADRSNRRLNTLLETFASP